MIIVLHLLFHLSLIPPTAMNFDDYKNNGKTKTKNILVYNYQGKCYNVSLLCWYIIPNQKISNIIFMNINILINNLILMYVYCAPKYRVHFVKYTLICSVYLLICVGVEPI